MTSNTVVAMRDVVQMCLVGFSIQIERVAMAESGNNNVACSSSILKHSCSLYEASKQVAETKKCSKGAINKFAYASID